MIGNFIKIGRPTKRAYGNEYPVAYVRSGKVVRREIMFGNDLASAQHAYTKDFETAKKIRIKKGMKNKDFLGY